jgi:3-hydroxyacyl-CoA dehydrogenase/enoyl-CoA hydratase/3-hydroxybutyryl-CoA epimerase
MRNLQMDIDQDGHAIVCFDVRDRTMNTVTAEVRRELDQVIEQVRADEAIRGVVLISARPTASSPALT